MKSLRVMLAVNIIGSRLHPNIFFRSIALAALTALAETAEAPETAKPSEAAKASEVLISAARAALGIPLLLLLHNLLIAC